MKLPFIFIFNIDKTIIGDINSLYYLIKTMNEKHYNIEDFKKRFIRPDFKDFIEFIKSKYQTIELYIYVNSNDNNNHIDWNIIIERIESFTNIKFNKPYFIITDEEKKLSNIYDTIIDDLIPKYPSLQKNKKYVFDNQLLYIDHIENNLKDYPEKQLLCPKYNYKLFDNYINEWAYKKLQEDIIYQSIIGLINIKYIEINNKNINDTYFKTLISIIKNDKTLILDNDKIKKINEY